jgi:hypothetical protein
VDGSNATIPATVFAYTYANPLAVRLSDPYGAYVGAGAGTQYAEGEASANIIGTAVLWEDAYDTLTPISVAKPLPVRILPGAANACSTFRSIDLDETEEEVKASAGTVYGWYIYNAATTPRYLKFYNLTTGDTTVGTSIPVLTIPLPAKSAANCSFPQGIAFDTAITVAATTGIADADTGAPGTNEVVMNLFYL